MNPQDKHKDDPVHIHLEENKDEHEDAGTHDEGTIEITRPSYNPVNHAKRRRELRNQTATADEEELPPSKTKIKKQMHELCDLGAELTELGKNQLAQLDLPENLRDAIREMKNINKFGAQRRQLQYIGKLMREVDTAPILAKLDAWKGTSRQHTTYMHQLERWRERLLESDSALTELLSVHPQADAQHLRTLIRNAQREILANKPPRNFREIFRVLREIIPEHS
jgi:ribosome-associated protein